MRASEFIFEAVRLGTLKFNGFEIAVDKHSMEQSVRRNVLPSDVDRVLKKISSIQDEIRAIPGGQQFWVYSPILDVGIGFRKVQDDSLKLLLKTVTGSKPYDGPTPILIVENFADGKKPGRKGLAKRSGVNCKQPVSKLRSIAKNSSGERQRMAHWCANMKSGKAKKNK
jgi:hypothetical protein